MTKKQRLKERDKLYEVFIAENKNYPMSWKDFKKAIEVNGGIEGTKKILGMNKPLEG